MKSYMIPRFGFLWYHSIDIWSPSYVSTYDSIYIWTHIWNMYNISYIWNHIWNMYTKSYMMSYVRTMRARKSYVNIWNHMLTYDFITYNFIGHRESRWLASDSPGAVGHLTVCRALPRRAVVGGGRPADHHHDESPRMSELHWQRLGPCHRDSGCLPVYFCKWVLLLLY